MLQRPLTPHQARVLRYLHDYVAKNGEFPTFRQAASDLGFSSPHSITSVVDALKKKGYIVKTSDMRLDFAPEHAYLHPEAKRQMQELYMKLVGDLQACLADKVGDEAASALGDDYRSRWRRFFEEKARAGGA